MKNIFITGASGFLGAKLLHKLSKTYTVVGTYSSHPHNQLIPLDITNKEQVLKVITEFKPDIVIHTIAMPDPDICEQNQEKTELVIHRGTKNIVEACASVGATLHYISTVYVFDGEKGHYSEEDTPHPVNFYGEMKLRAENEVKTLDSYVIYRFDKLYGYNGKEYPNDMLSKILSGQPYAVNSEQVRQPLLIDDIATIIKRLDEIGFNGILHLAGPDRITKYELCRKLGALLGKEDVIVPITQEKQIAMRPKDPSIVTTKALSLGISFTPLEKALELIKEQLKVS